MKQLNESGLQRNDLDYLVMPLIDIDNFESKIDNAKAIVLAFYVFEQEPAKDLEHFIEKGDFEILDAETSPAPTEDGYYVVFIELNRDIDFPELTMDIVEQINNLTNVKDWQFKTLNSNDVHDLSEENLRKFVNLDPQLVPKTAEDVKDDIDDEQDALRSEPAKEEPEAEAKPEKKAEPKKEKATAAPTIESASMILKDSLMENVIGYGDVITLVGPGINKGYKLRSISDREPSVPIVVPRIGDPLLSESSKLSRMLGQSYTVDTVEGGLLVGHDSGYLILEPID